MNNITFGAPPALNCWNKDKREIAGQFSKPKAKLANDEL
jgi:hypothetical protein